MSAVRRPVVSATVADDETTLRARLCSAPFSAAHSAVWRAQYAASWRRSVASVLAATRRDRDVTQQELARRVGWTRDTITKVEAGTRRVEFGDVVIIAQALGERTERILQRILTWNR